MCLELAKRGFRGGPSISLRAMVIIGSSVIREAPVWFFIDRHGLSLQCAV